MARQSSNLGARQLPESEFVPTTTTTSSFSSGQATRLTASSVSNHINNTHSAVQDEVATKSTKRKREKQDNELKQDAPTTDEINSEAAKEDKKRPKNKETTTPSTVITPSTPKTPFAIPINRSDPCSFLPTEIWHLILSYLPPSKIAQTSLFSKNWLDGARSSPIRKSICSTAGLGKPKLKYKSYMSLTCVNSYWICDTCFSFSKGRPQPSNIPLPVPFYNDKITGETVETQNDIWMLCLACRHKYIDEGEKELMAERYSNERFYCVDGIRKVSRTVAFKYYGLTEWGLDGLAFTVQQYPFYRSPGMRLYKRDDVQKLAVKIHGGRVGVDAVFRKVFLERLWQFRRHGMKCRVAGARVKWSENG